MTDIVEGEFTGVGDSVVNVRENADRLGLTWTRLVATVVDGSDPSNITLTLDGDTVVQRAWSLMGPLGAGARVYCDKIPPQGLYVAGYANAPEFLCSAEMTAGAGTSVTSGAITNVSLPTTTWDYCGFTTAYDGIRLRAPSNGIFDVSAALTFSAGGVAASFRSIIINKNNATYVEDKRAANPTLADTTQCTISYPVPCVAGDTLHMTVFQNSTATLTVTGRFTVIARE